MRIDTLGHVQRRTPAIRQSDQDKHVRIRLRPPCAFRWAAQGHPACFHQLFCTWDRIYSSDTFAMLFASLAVHIPLSSALVLHLWGRSCTFILFRYFFRNFFFLPELSVRAEILNFFTCSIVLLLNSSDGAKIESDSATCRNHQLRSWRSPWQASWCCIHTLCLGCHLRGRQTRSDRL